MTTKDGEMKTEKETMATAKETSAKATADIAKDTQDVTIMSATLRDDQAYLLDLSAKCESRAKLWDERTAMRTEEISALGTALQILKDVDAKGDEEAPAEEGLVQQRARLGAVLDADAPVVEHGAGAES